MGVGRIIKLAVRRKKGVKGIERWWVEVGTFLNFSFMAFCLFVRVIFEEIFWFMDDGVMG